MNIYRQISTCVCAFMPRWSKQRCACASLVLQFLRNYTLLSYWAHMNLASKGMATARSELIGAVSDGESLHRSFSHWHTSIT